MPFGLPDPLGTGSGVGYAPTGDYRDENPDSAGLDGGGDFLDRLGGFINTIGTNVGRVYQAVNPPAVRHAGPSTLPSSGGTVLGGLGQLGPLLLFAAVAFVVVRLLRR